MGGDDRPRRSQTQSVITLHDAQPESDWDRSPIFRPSRRDSFSNENVTTRNPVLFGRLALAEVRSGTAASDAPRQNFGCTKGPLAGLIEIRTQIVQMRVLKNYRAKTRDLAAAADSYCL
jgi:hypothetical protein